MRRGEVVPEEIAERAGSRVRLNTRAGADVCTADVTTSWLNRRKARTRASLVAAARTLLASRDPAEISIQEITDAADVGFGSFYNHFRSKQDLFDAAVDEVLEVEVEVEDHRTWLTMRPARHHEQYEAHIAALYDGGPRLRRASLGSRASRRRVKGPGGALTRSPSPNAEGRVRRL